MAEQNQNAERTESDRGQSAPSDPKPAATGGRITKDKAGNAVGAASGDATPTPAPADPLAGISESFDDIFLGEQEQSGATTRDIITVVRDTDSPLGKSFTLKADGTILKGAKVTVSTVIAVQRHVLDGVAMRDLLLEVADDPRAAIIYSSFPDIPVGEEFVILSQGTLNAALKKPAETRPVGVHTLERFPGKKVVARLLENQRYSSWALFDRDVDAHTPERFRDDALPKAKWVEAMDKIIPGFSVAERVEARSTTARVQYPDGTNKVGGNGHMWVRIADPDDAERLAKLAIMGRAVEAGLSWKKPNFSRKEPGVVVGETNTTIVDNSVLNLGRLAFVGQPTVGPEFKLLPHGVEVVNPGGGVLDTSAAVFDPVRTREVYAKVGTKAECKSGPKGGLLLEIADLTLATEIELADGSSITVRDAIPMIEARGKLRCQTPFRESYSLAAFINLRGGMPFVFDVGSGITHRLNRATEAALTFEDELGGAQDIPDEEPAVEPDEPAEPPPNAGEVIAKLLAIGAEEAKLVWVKMVLPMNRIDTAEVLRALNTRYGWGLRDMNGELADEKGRIAAEAAVATAEAQLNGRAVVELNATQTARMAKKAEVALLKVVKLHDYCLFGDNLSCVNVRAIPGMHAIDRPDLAPPPVVSIAPLVDAEIVAKLERTVAFCTMNRQGKPTSVSPVPRPVVEQLRSSLREFGPRTVPIITGVATRPMVLADGTILNTEGLDPRTGLFLYKTAVMPITAFTKAEAEQALNELRKGDFSAGFDFGTRLDRDTAIATLFTGVQRRLLAEAPGTLINATVQSSGKTTLARRIHLIVTGRDMPVSGVPREEVEMKKSVEALLRYNPEMVCFDNIPDGHTFRSETLARVMTSSEMSARILGVSENMVLPTNVLWLLTGNNVGLGNDELTRFMRVNLSPNSFNPETRVFARPDVVAHAREIRERVLQLALGIIAGFLVSGDTTAPKSRFHDWDRLVRQPLIWCGGEDVATCFEENAGRSEAKAALSDLIEALIAHYEDEDKQVRFTLSQLANDLLRVKEAKPDVFQTLSVINESLVALRAKEVTSLGSLGHAFSSVEGQLVRLNDGAGAKLLRKKSPGLGRHWEVERVSTPT